MRRHYRLLNAEEAIPEIPCARCHAKSKAAARHPNHLCLVCEAFQRKKQGL